VNAFFNPKTRPEAERAPPSSVPRRRGAPVRAVAPAHVLRDELALPPAHLPGSGVPGRGPHGRGVDGGNGLRLGAPVAVLAAPARLHVPAPDHVPAPAALAVAAAAAAAGDHAVEVDQERDGKEPAADLVLVGASVFLVGGGEGEWAPAQSRRLERARAAERSSARQIWVQRATHPGQDDDPAARLCLRQRGHVGLLGVVPEHHTRDSPPAVRQAACMLRALRVSQEG